MATQASKAPEKKLSENIGSIILGFVVVLILGGFLLNVFRGDNKDSGEVGESGDTVADELAQASKGVYVVKSGETLWIIAERETGSGYNWLAIAKENNLESADDIEEGQELRIPDKTRIRELIGETVETIAQKVEEIRDEREEEQEQEEKIEEPTQAPTEEPTAEPTEPEKVSEIRQPKSGEYSVQGGDSLWKIAVDQYDDGYRWVDIAQANNLDNPDVIHTGNVLVLP